MNGLPELIVHDSGKRSSNESATLEWRLITRGTRAVTARIGMNVDGGAVSGGRVSYGAEGGQTGSAALGDEFTVEPGDLIQAFFTVTPDGTRAEASAVAILCTSTGEHTSPPALIGVDRAIDVDVAWFLYESDGQPTIEVNVTAKSDIPEVNLALDEPEQLIVEPLIMSAGPLSAGGVATLRVRVQLDDDAPVTLANARVMIGGVAFALPPMTIPPSNMDSLELSVGGPSELALGEVSEAWIRVLNTGRRPRVASPALDVDGITIARSPESRIVPAGGTQRWTISFAGARQGAAMLRARLGNLSESCEMTVRRSHAHVAVRGAASFDNVADATYELKLSVRDFAQGSRLSIIPAPGMTPESIIGLGGAGVITPTYPAGTRFQTNAVLDGDDAVTIVFAATTIDRPEDHPGAIILFEHDADGTENQIASHSVVVRARSIVTDCTVSRFDVSPNPGESTQLKIGVTNKGSATASLPFVVRAENFVDVTWDDSLPITDLLTVIGQSRFERSLIAHLRTAPPGRTTTTIGLTIGNRHFSRVISIRNPARVGTAKVQASESGFTVAFTNDGTVAADEVFIVVRGADIRSAQDDTGRVLPVSESRIFCGRLDAQGTTNIAVAIERYHAAAQIAIIIGDSRVDLTYHPPTENIMTFGGIAAPAYAYETQLATPVEPAPMPGENTEHRFDMDQQSDGAGEQAFPTFNDLADTARAETAQTAETDFRSQEDDLQHFAEEIATLPYLNDHDSTSGDFENNDELQSGSQMDEPDAAEHMHDGEAAQPLRALGADDFLGKQDMLMLYRLRSIKQPTRAIHAYVASLFIDGNANEGSALRSNIVSALASETIGHDPAESWTIMPSDIREWLGQESETQAVAYLAEHISSTQNLAPPLKEYLEAIATSYRSLDGLAPDSLRERLFAPADQLDTLLNVAIPMEARV